MSELLDAHSSVYLFGREVEDLTISSNITDDKDKPRFARVYGFSFGGVYFEMAGATLIKVIGPGTAAHESKVPGPGLDDDDPFYKSLMVWAVDKGDRSTFLDVESGTFEDVLLGDPDGGPGISGAKVTGAKVSGAKVSGAKVSGAKLSGAKLSGAKLSGARVSGAKLSGD